MRVAPGLIAGMLLGTGAFAAEPAQRVTPDEQPAAQRTPSPAAPAARVPARPTSKIPNKAGAKKAEPELTFTTAEMDKLAQIEALAHERYPRRRDTPLRYVNISDNEVREIESLAAKVSMPELVNIAPVVTGCPCEEGVDCTEQVYIVGRYKDRHVGLQLSRVKNRWGIGRVQRWWLDYSALLAREKGMDRRMFTTAHARQLLDFPTCPGVLIDKTASATAATATAPPARR